MRFLKNTRNGCPDFLLCFTLSIGAKLSFFQKKNEFFGPAVQNGRNHSTAHLGLKMGEIQKTFLLQVFAILWTIIG